MSKKRLTYLLFASLALNVIFAAASIVREQEHATGEPPLTSGTADDANPQEPSSVAEVLSSNSTYPLLRVIDGDTIVIGIGERSESVRMIGIDTPELSDPGGPECYAQEARSHLEKIIQGTVTIVLDPSQGERDSFNRLLAYVETNEGVDIGAQMIRDGYATEYTYEKPYDRKAAYEAAEADAIANTRGLWSPDACALN